MIKEMASEMAKGTVSSELAQNKDLRACILLGTGTEALFKGKPRSRASRTGWSLLPAAVGAETEAPARPHWASEPRLTGGCCPACFQEAAENQGLPCDSLCSSHLPQPLFLSLTHWLFGEQTRLSDTIGLA